MKKYVVKNTPLLEKKLDKYISYLKNEKKSLQAAQSLFDDFIETRKSLEKTAGMLQNPDDDNLKSRNLKRINSDITIISCFSELQRTWLKSLLCSTDWKITEKS